MLLENESELTTKGNGYDKEKGFMGSYLKLSVNCMYTHLLTFLQPQTNNTGTICQSTFDYIL